MEENGWDLLIICNHPATFDKHKHCDSGYVMFLNSHMILQDQVTQGPCDLMEMDCLR